VDILHEFQSVADVVLGMVKNGCFEEDTS
jgi:hypothetical protein